MQVGLSLSLSLIKDQGLAAPVMMLLMVLCVCLGMLRIGNEITLDNHPHQNGKLQVARQVLSPNSPELWAVDDGGPCVMDPAAQ